METKPDAASVALIEGTRVLLVRRARPPAQGLWTLPGGRLEAGETAEQCAAREIGEELGLRVGRLRPVTQLSVGEARRFLLQVFATETFAGEVTPSDEIADWRWVPAHAPAGLATTPGLGDVLARAMAIAGRR